METAYCSSPKPDLAPNMVRCWLYQPSVRDVYSVGRIEGGTFRHDPVGLHGITDRNKEWRVGNECIRMEMELRFYKSHHI